MYIRTIFSKSHRKQWSNISLKSSIQLIERENTALLKTNVVAQNRTQRLKKRALTALFFLNRNNYNESTTAMHSTVNYINVKYLNIICLLYYYFLYIL